MNKLERLFKHLLQESRKIYKDIPRVSAYEELEPYTHKDGYFISFTDLDKLGINPKSSYNTPIGIYTYPLKESFKRYNVHSFEDVSKTIPFGNTRPYVWLVKVKEGKKILTLHAYTKEELTKDVQTLRDYYNKNKELFDEDKLDREYRPTIIGGKKAPDFMGRRNYTSMEELFAYYNKTGKPVKVDKSVEQRPGTVQSPGRSIWQITREMARCFKEGKPHVKWNTLFYRVLGYSAVVDLKGHGIIHPNEPTQAVFFNRQAFTVVKQIHNKSFSHKKHWFYIGKENGSIKVSREKFRLYPSSNKFIWYNGTWHNGKWKEGTWYNGTWEDGIWVYGFWRNGTWKGGEWRNGVWKNGVWENGYWKGGAWYDGEWKDGWILDVGNGEGLHPEWDRDKNGFVRSPVSPKEYFKKRVPAPLPTEKEEPPF